MREIDDGSGTAPTEPEKDAWNAPVFSLSEPELRSVPEALSKIPVPPVTKNVDVNSSNPSWVDAIPEYVPNKEFSGISVDVKSNIP
jgi:hypothetical protein